MKLKRNSLNSDKIFLKLYAILQSNKKRENSVVPLVLIIYLFSTTQIIAFVIL